MDLRESNLLWWWFSLYPQFRIHAQMMRLFNDDWIKRYALMTWIYIHLPPFLRKQKGPQNWLTNIGWMCYCIATSDEDNVTTAIIFSINWHLKVLVFRCQVAWRRSGDLGKRWSFTSWGNDWRFSFPWDPFNSSGDELRAVGWSLGTQRVNREAAQNLQPAY